MWDPYIRVAHPTVGHKSTHVTETVYRHVIVPAIRGEATAKDNIFDGNDNAAGAD